MGGAKRVNLGAPVIANIATPITFNSAQQPTQRSKSHGSQRRRMPRVSPWPRHPPGCRRPSQFQPVCRCDTAIVCGCHGCLAGFGTA